MDQKEKYESFCKETKQLKRKMLIHLAAVFGVVILMIAVLVILYFTSPTLLGRETLALEAGERFQNTFMIGLDQGKPL